jgi:dihydroflavonol-4-reductase
MAALVIGASGHLGAHLVRVLRKQGIQVRAFVRPTSDLRGLEGVDVEIVRGDVVDSGTLPAAVDGCEEVYHLASPTNRQPDAASTIVAGTRNVLNACQQAGVRRVVYTSSIVTVGYSSSPDIILDERANQRTDATTYHTAKWLAEREVIAFARTDGPRVVIVNPATLVGPLDYRVTPSNAPIQRCLEGGLRVAVPGGVTVVHVEDAARGLWLAMERGRPGERYILGGDRLTIRDYFTLIAEQSGRPGPLLTLPRSAVLASGAAFSVVERLTKRPMPFSFSQARHLAGRYGWYSSEKAVRELGYGWRPAVDAVKAYVGWVRSGRPPAHAGAQ